VHRLTGGIPRLINQICDISLTYGYAEQSRFITSKLVAQAATDRSRGGILPLGVTDELSAMAASADDPNEIPDSVQLPELNVPSFRCDVPEPEPVVNQSAPDVLYRRGMALKKEKRFKEAIESFDRARQTPSSYCLKASEQIGLCHFEMGETHEAIEALRTALRDQSASRNEVIKAQYSLARALESVGEGEEAASFYQGIMLINPSFKDTAARMKRLSVPQNALNGKRPVGTKSSWFGHVLDSLHQIIGSRP
jgi:hypothetical protein